MESLYRDFSDPQVNWFMRYTSADRLFSKASWNQIATLIRLQKALCNRDNPATYRNQALLHRYNKIVAQINSRGDMMRLAIVFRFEMDKKMGGVI